MLEEVGSEGRTVEFVGAVQDNIVADVGVCATCCLREDRRHVPLEFLQRRLLATSEELLVARNRRGSMQMRVRHCRLQQVEARGQPVCGIFTPQRGLSGLVCPSRTGTREEPGTLTQGVPVFPGSSRLEIEPKSLGWLV